MPDTAQTHMGGSRRRTTPRHGPPLESDEAPGVRDDPPEDPVDVASLDQSGLDAADPEDVAGPVDVDMVGPDEADLAAEAALEGVDLEDLGDLADVDGLEMDADHGQEDKDGSRAAAGDLDDALTAGPLAAGTPGVSAPEEKPAPAGDGGAAAAEQPSPARTGAGEGEDEAFVYGDNDNDLPAAQVASAGATADPVKDYLKQIGKVPLLNAEQEVELAKRIEAGLFAEEKLAKAAEALPPGQRIDIEWIAEDGRRAKNHLVEANLRLVVSLAKRYTGRGMLFLDLIQEGSLGLIRAVENL